MALGTVERLLRSDIPALLAGMSECAVVDVETVDNVPRSVTFDTKPFRMSLTTASMLGEASHDDLDRAWLWAGFKCDEATDLPFINDFNSKGHASCAALTDGGVELCDHFLLSGLQKDAASLIILMHVSTFSRELTEFNLARNERARSLSTN